MFANYCQCERLITVYVTVELISNYLLALLLLGGEHVLRFRQTTVFGGLLLCFMVISACSSTAPEPPAPVDLDNDGVYQPFDTCPSTPANVRVAEDGCPSDTDGDGVPDYLDDCPDTLPGVAACQYGCALTEPLVINLTNDAFNVDSDSLTRPMLAVLDKLVDSLHGQEDALHLTVIGHTDNTGTAAYNLDLSIRRAQATMSYLRLHGPTTLRLDHAGRGEAEPVATNRTADGRAKNRRVDIFSHTVGQHRLKGSRL